MRKIIFLILISIYSFNTFAAGPSPTDSKGKTTASTGVKAATKFDIGLNGYLKQKNLKKKISKLKLKMPTKKQSQVYYRLINKTLVILIF